MVTVLSDAELLESAREGDQAALAELYIRHRAVARRVAATSCRGVDPDDLVNEAFEKVFAAVRRRTGPTDAFRAYLFVTMRRLAARHSARNRDDPYDEVPEPVMAAAGGGMDPSERDIVTSAFSSLPDRWQAVLWHTAVEGRHPRDVARSMGMSANAVSALAYRAREKLRQAYLQAHLQTSSRPECEPHRSALGAYVRGGLGHREHAATQRHVDRCRPCQDLVGELDDVNHLLARALLPMFLVEGIGEVAAGAGGATTASGLAGASDVLAAFTPQHLAAGAPGGVQKLLMVLPGGATAKAAGGAVAALLAVGALGTAGTRLLPDETPAGPEVVTEGDPTAAAPRTPPEDPSGTGLQSLDIPARDCLPREGGPGTGRPDQPAGDPGTASGDDLDSGDGDSDSDGAAASPETGGDGLLGLDLELEVPLGQGGLDLPPVTSPDVPEGLRIEDVRCEPSSGSGKLVMTLGGDPETTTPQTEPEPPAEPDPLVETGDVVPEVLPEVLPDVDAGVTVELDDGLGAEIDTNLAELCERDPEGGQDLVCTLDSSLGGAITGTVAGTGAELQVDGQGGNVLTVRLRDGDVVLDTKIINLLP